ncbi:MAG: IS5 family transposase [Candidatus Loosdrechtia sp.]|uniref:IS5 family transposase n=1 Tax=Candidatus Loosdrechtia sp. TaxID=3101272 RepID=UPI003A6BD5EF|nr:MAG: IS5 family transposase [Candidatus Jettenia sp. AMX2]WKZ22710.1 MAG: IS5 family transposase [Candidatus Jettenia sp. AMX2]
MKRQKQKTKKKALKAQKIQKAKKSNKPKKSYRVRNWSEYNEALKQRGSLDVWIDENVQEEWHAEPTGKRGAQPLYSDLAITSTLQFGIVFHQRLRQTEGLVKSLFRLMGINLEVPDYSTLSRRGESIRVSLPKEDKEKVVILIDSSGLKVYGEGEWKVRQHGYSKRRTWRKIHLAVTPEGEIRATELTENSISDDEAASKLLSQEESRIEGIVGDGAYDKKKVYDSCIGRGIPTILIPPRKDAKIWQHGNSNAEPHPRDENLRHMRSTSRKRWKEVVKYHVRSLVENTIFRLKSIFGDKLYARILDLQRTEVTIKAAILNRMMKLGMPESYAIA